MRDRLALDVRVTAAQIERLRVTYPDLADDLQLLCDTLEGETEFLPVMERVTEEYLDSVSMKAAVSDRMSALAERRDRFDRKADALKAMAMSLMEAAGQPKVQLPVATLSITKGRTSVVVDDVDALPQGYFATERKPLKTAIKEAIEHGEIIPGARLETGDDGLTVRTK